MINKYLLRVEDDTKVRVVLFLFVSLLDTEFKYPIL